MPLKRIITPDALVNVCLPLTVGILSYSFTWHDNQLVKNHLADGLWAYAFTSQVLIIWRRKIKWLWLSTILITALIFEGCQYFKLIEGTSDFLDLATYFIFFSAALLSNRFLKSKYKPSIYETN